MALYQSVLQLIGNTPLVRLSGIEKACGCQARLYGKIEYFNPAGSVKDRAAYEMICQAEKDGRLVKGGTVIEATSGNTGIALAMVCQAKGYAFVAVMPENMSKERQQLLRAYGAKVVLTDGAQGMVGAVEKSKQLHQEITGSFIPDQFSSDANAQSHYKTTGVEIYRDLPDAAALICAVGSGGTLTGTARYLKEKNDKLCVVAVEPSNSPVLSGGQKGAHAIEGIGAGFIPKTLDKTLIDEIYLAKDEEAFATARRAALTDGLFVGISSGAALSAAIEWAKRKENKDKKAVVILPDGGGRYLSTALVKEE